MYVSELMGWHWAITWDNPVPADSSKMMKQLAKLGRLTRVQTKTTVLLAPKRKVKWRKIRKVLVNNLHPSKGNVFYVNLRSGRAFERGSSTNFKWKRAG
jgi:hypothetical protein